MRRATPSHSGALPRATIAASEGRLSRLGVDVGVVSLGICRVGKLLRRLREYFCRELNCVRCRSLVKLSRGIFRLFPRKSTTSLLSNFVFPFPRRLCASPSSSFSPKTLWCRLHRPFRGQGDELGIRGLQSRPSLPPFYFFKNFSAHFLRVSRKFGWIMNQGGRRRRGSTCDSRAPSVFDVPQPAIIATHPVNTVVLKPSVRGWEWNRFQR